MRQTGREENQCVSPTWSIKNYSLCKYIIFPFKKILQNNIKNLDWVHLFKLKNSKWLKSQTKNKITKKVVKISDSQIIIRSACAFVGISENL